MVELASLASNWWQTIESGFPDFGWSPSVWFLWLAMHFLWQGLLIGLAVYLASMVGGRSARFRHDVAVLGLIMMLGSVLVTAFNGISESSAKSTTVPGGLNFNSNAPVALSVGPTRPIPMEELTLAEQWSLPVMVGYLVGVGLMVIRFVVSHCGVWRLRSAVKTAPDALRERVSLLSKRMGMRVAPELRISNRIHAPVAMGILKPAVLLPASILSGLTQSELDGILTHELAHLRRNDLLVNYVQRVVEALLFFHPCVWLVSRQITVERENCCDDIVLADCDREEYVHALLRIAERSISSADATRVLALAATGARPSQLRRRVMRLMGDQASPSFVDFRFAALSIVLVGGMAMHLFAQTPNNSRESSPVKANPIAKDRSIRLKLGFDVDGNVTHCELLLEKDTAMQKVTELLKKLDEKSIEVRSIGFKAAGKYKKVVIAGANLPADVLSATVKTRPAEVASAPEAPVTIQPIEGTDILVTRGRKEDVEKVTGLLEALRDPSGKAKPVTPQASNATDIGDFRSARRPDFEKLVQAFPQKFSRSAYVPKHAEAADLVMFLQAKYADAGDSFIGILLSDDAQKVLIYSGKTTHQNIIELAKKLDQVDSIQQTKVRYLVQYTDATVIAGLLKKRFVLGLPKVEVFPATNAIEVVTRSILQRSIGQWIRQVDSPGQADLDFKTMIERRGPSTPLLFDDEIERAMMMDSFRMVPAPRSIR